MSTTDLALIAGDTSALERAGDPAEFVVLACERAKEWLKQAVEHGEIDQIVEVKSQAEAIRIYTAQKQLGKDAELAAAEIVRRAERGIGIAVRRGQEEGQIRTQGESGGPQGDYVRTRNGQVEQVRVPPREASKKSARDYFANDTEQRDALVMTDDVTDDEFEQAISHAKAEQNLSRANVIRKVQAKPAAGTMESRIEQARALAATGHSRSQIAKKIGVSLDYVREICRRGDIETADAIVGKTRNIDPNRVMRESVSALEGLVMGLNLIADDLDRLDPAEVKDWAISFGASVRSLNRFRKQLEEMALDD